MHPSWTATRDEEHAVLTVMHGPVRSSLYATRVVKKSGSVPITS